MSNPVDIVGVFQQAEAALRENPAFAAAMDRAKSANVPPEAVAQMVLANMDEGAKATLLAFAHMLDRATVNQPAPPLAVKHPNGSTALNPVFGAALAERVAFDGDVPEFRHGPLPEDAAPAVPVKTDSRNLVQVGLMLERASQEVAREYQAALSEHGVQAARLLAQAEQEGPQSAALVRQALDALVPTGVKGYEAGALPTLREVAPPTMGELALLSPSEERRLAWKAVSTTQGRRSLTPVFERALAERFPNVTFGGAPPKNAAEIRWSCTAFGADDLDPNFALVENGIQRFAHALAALKGEHRASVRPVGEIANRTFGWALCVWAKEQG